MSFSSEVKTEICSHRLNKRCCRRAEAFGMSLGIRTKKDGRFSFKCSNHDVATHAMHSFIKNYTLCEINQSKNFIYSVDSIEPFDVRDSREIELNNECCLSAYIRGAFLACGQLSNPGQNYRLDFNLANHDDAKSLYDRLVEAGFSPMISLKSSGRATVYFKNSGFVEDLMIYMGAPLSTLDLMEIRVEKDYKNHLNRTVNFETANYVRTYSVGEHHKEAINRLIESGMLDNLADDVKLVASLRLENPDASLSELASLASMSKSSVNRRLKYILEIYEKLKEKS